MNNNSSYETPKKSSPQGKRVSILKDEMTPQSTKRLASHKMDLTTDNIAVTTPTVPPVALSAKKSIMKQVLEAAGLSASAEGIKAAIPSVVPPLKHVFYGRSPFGEGKVTFLREFKKYPEADRVKISCIIGGVSYPLSDYVIPGEHYSSEQMEAWKAKLINLPGTRWSDTGKFIEELFYYLHTERGLASQAMGFANESVIKQHERLLFGTRGSSHQICELHIEQGLQEIRHIDHKDYFHCNFYPPTGELEDVVLGGPHQGRDPLIQIKFSNRYVLGPLAENDHHDVRRRLFTHALRSNREKTLTAAYERELVQIASYNKTEIKEKLKKLYENEVAQKYKHEFRAEYVDKIYKRIEEKIETEEIITSKKKELEAQTAPQKPAAFQKLEAEQQKAIKTLMQDKVLEALRVKELRSVLKLKHKEQFDIALKHDIDETDSFSHEELSHALIALMEKEAPNERSSRESSVSRNLSIHSFRTITLDPHSDVAPSSLKPATPKHTHFRKFQNDDFKNLGEVPAWDHELTEGKLTNPVDYALVKMDDIELADNEHVKPKRTGKIFFSANSIEVAPEYSQFATETQDEIEASNFNELFLLRYIAENLEKNSSIFRSLRNKKGLCVTLLRYLENPLLANEKNAEYLTLIRKILSNIKSYDDKKLIEITRYLIDEQFLAHKHVVEEHYKNLATYSPVMVWENVKRLLRETGFVKQLHALAELMRDYALNEFATACENNLKEGVSLDALQKFLKQEGSKHALVQSSVVLMKQVSDICKFPYRADFSVTPASATPEDPFSEHLFLVYCREKIEGPIGAIKKNVAQLEALNACYVLLECYDQFSPRRQIIGDAIASAITELKKPAEHVVDEKIQEIIATLKTYLVENLHGNELEKLSALLGDSLRKSHSKTINWFVAQLNKAAIKIGDADSFQCFNKAYYLSYVTERFYDNFDEISDVYLEDIRKKFGGVDNDLYIQSLILRSFYVSLSGYHLHNNPPNDSYRKFFYSRFIDDPSEWVTAFQAKKLIMEIVPRVNQTIVALRKNDQAALESGVYVVSLANSLRFRSDIITDDKVEEEVVKSIKGAIKKIGHCVNAALRDKRTPEVYIQEIKQSLESKNAAGVTPFGLLSLKGQAILRVCAWMAALVNRYGTKEKIDGQNNIFLEENIKYIYDQIQSAWQDMSGDTPTLMQNTWDAYKELEILGEGAEEECRKVLSKKSSVTRALFSEESDSPLVSSNSAEITKQRPTQCFNAKGCYISSSQENIPMLETQHFDELQWLDFQVTIWRHVAERFTKNLRGLISPHAGLSSKTSMADSLKSGQNKNQVLKAGMAEIFVTLAFLYVDATGVQLEQAAEVIECVEDVLSSGSRKSTPRRNVETNSDSPPKKTLGTELLDNIRERLKVNPELPASQVIRAILFSDPAHKIFRGKNFVKEIERRFSLPKPEPVASTLIVEESDVVREPSEFIDVFSFLKSVEDGLTFVCQQLSIENQYVFLRYMMEPLLTAFILAYAELFNTQHPIPSAILELFQKCITLVETIGRQEIITVLRSNENFLELGGFFQREKNYYLSFAEAWWMIQENVFDKLQERDVAPTAILDNKGRPRLDSENKIQWQEKFISKKQLRKIPYDLVLAYYIYAKLNVKPANFESAMSVNNRLWREISPFDLTLEIAKVLRFIFGPIPDCHLSAKALERIRPENEPHLSEKQERSSVFFTHEEPTIFRKSVRYPVKQALSLGRVFCVLVSNVSDEASHSMLGAFNQRRVLEQMTQDVMSKYRARLECLQKARSLLKQPSDDSKALQNFILTTPLDYPIVLVYYQGQNFRCIEIFENVGQIVRRDCLASDSYLLARAGIVLPTHQRGIFEDIIHKHSSFKATLEMRMSLEFLTILLDLLHDSMALIMRCADAPKIPITKGLISFINYRRGMQAFRAYDDPRALQQCELSEIIGLFIVGLIYTIFTKQEELKAGSAGVWLLNFVDFFKEPSNLRNLATRGVDVVLKWWGTSDNKDPVVEQLQILERALPKHDSKMAAKNQQNEYCRWYEEHPNYHPFSASESRTSLASSSRSESDVIVPHPSPALLNLGSFSPGNNANEWHVGASPVRSIRKKFTKQTESLAAR